MRLAYLVCDPGIPIGGTKGASVHVASLSRALAAIGVEVTLFAPKVLDPRIPGVEVVEVPVGPVPSGPAGELRRIEAARVFYEQVAQRLEGTECDLVMERLALFADGGGLERRLGVDRLVEVNAPVAAEREAHFVLEYRDAAEDAEARALAGATVVAVSQPLAEWALARGAATAEVIPNGADTSLLDPARWGAEGARLRAELGFGDLPVIGFVGSLKPWHGVESIFSAAERLAGSHHSGLLGVGDGPGREMVQAGLARFDGRVTAVATGAVPADAVPSYLAAMDVAVAPYLPSASFYFSPLKVAEAMAAGKAVVASDFPPVRELLGDCGLLVPAGDATALAGALEKLIGSADLRAELGERARTRALERADWVGVARRTISAAQSTKRSASPEGARAANS
ncbi:MAG: glycosyltransferase [Actinomycetota bacterium]|nr:glycosyltransferase [Actinomycetota bacterium]